MADKRKIKKKKDNSAKKITAAKLLGARRPSERKPARKKSAAKKTKTVGLQKFGDNPIIEPTEKTWESRATFNPAAAYAGGRIHVLYRAIGDDDMSVLGYASSPDGFNFNRREDSPAYIPEGIAKTERGDVPLIAYCSGGGGWGGSEDPRMVIIDSRVYMTFLAFNGWNSARIALTSINLADFLGGKWNWRKPVYLSPEGEIHKNWVLFPEKINGKFAILHSVSPDILIDYFDSLDALDDCIQSSHAGGGREKEWDNVMRGAGPPPIKTEYGWLLLYHAMDKRDPDRYKLGAMILDLRDPTKILYRAKNPILEPDEAYENDGYKPGVIYCCGAVAVNDRLFVYYGGADRVVCTATADLTSFLENLKSGHAVKLKVKSHKP